MEEEAQALVVVDHVIIMPVVRIYICILRREVDGIIFSQ